MSLIENINDAFDKGKQILLVIDKANYDLLNNIAYQLEELATKVIVVIDGNIEKQLTGNYNLHHEFSYGWKIIYAIR